MSALCKILEKSNDCWWRAFLKLQWDIPNLNLHKCRCTLLINSSLSWFHLGISLSFYNFIPKILLKILWIFLQIAANAGTAFVSATRASRVTCVSCQPRALDHWTKTGSAVTRRYWTLRETAVQTDSSSRGMENAARKLMPLEFVGRRQSSSRLTTSQCFGCHCLWCAFCIPYSIRELYELILVSCFCGSNTELTVTSTALVSLNWWGPVLNSVKTRKMGHVGWAPLKLVPFIWMIKSASINSLANLDASIPVLNSLHIRASWHRKTDFRCSRCRPWKTIMEDHFSKDGERLHSRSCKWLRYFQKIPIYI